MITRLRGSLAEGLMPGLLRNVYLGRRTGFLNVTSGSDRGSVVFINGHIVHGSTTVEEYHMGTTMVRHQLITQEDLDRASEIVRGTGKRLGVVLKELGIVDDERLQDALALHVREVLRCIFSWTDGSYEFEEQPPEAFKGYDRALRLSTGEVILDAVWSVRDPEAVRYALGNLDRVLVLPTDPLLRFQRITFTPTDGFILSRVDGILTAREILEMTPVGPEEAQRSLLGLLCTGTVEYLTTPPNPEKTAEPARTLRQKILDLHRNLALRDHFEVLGIPRTASEAEVKAVYFRLARLLHPDARHDPSLDDLHETLDAVFARLCQAYGVLSDAQARAAYERTLPVAVRAPGPERPTPPLPVPPPDPAAETARVDGALNRAAELVAADKHWDAIRLLEETLPEARGRVRQRCRTLLARCYLRNAQWRQSAEEQLLAAISEDAGFAEAYYLLGTIYKDGGLHGRAAVMFRRVLELKPRHTEARAGLESLPSGVKSDTGFFRKLFFRPPKR